MNDAVPPDSVVRNRNDVDGVGNTVNPVMSSSASVSVAPVTAPTPWVFIAVPVTVPERLLALSTSSFTAVIAAVSAVAVCPAAITIVVSEPTV